MKLLSRKVRIRVDFLVLLCVVAAALSVFFRHEIAPSSRAVDLTSSSSLGGASCAVLQGLDGDERPEDSPGSGVAAGIPPLDVPAPEELAAPPSAATVADAEREFPPRATVAQAITGQVSLLALADSGQMDAIPDDVQSDNAKDGSKTVGGGASSAQVNVSESAMTLANQVRNQLDDLLADLSPTALSSHDSYIIIRRLLQNSLLRARRKFMVRAADTVNTPPEELASLRRRAKCFQFVRDDQKPRDAINRIPCVAWDSERLHTVALAKYGVLSQYHHIDPPTAEDLKGRVAAETPSPSGRPPLRIAVAMSGQMRTYKRCYQSIVDNVLKTNNALLFLASYPDVGDKRFGVRVLERDDEVDAAEVAKMFSSYLAAMYTTDLPTLTRRLHGEFPTMMVTSQHSWMLYQLFMMDLAHNVLLKHPLGTWTDGVYKPFTVHKSTQLADGSMFTAKPWANFEVVVRIRPDLYILGPMWIRPIDATHATFNFTCGGNVFSNVFSNKKILRAPHHPYYQWVLDPISDHSAIGYVDQVTTLFGLYKDARRLTPTAQEREIFFHGNTVERMWTQHIARRRLSERVVFGWHIMLRNPSKFLHSSFSTGSSERRKFLIMKIFAVTDPSTVECPPVDGKMWILPKKRRR